MHANQHEHSELRAWQTMRIPAFNLIFLTTSPAVHSLFHRIPAIQRLIGLASRISRTPAIAGGMTI